MENNYFGTTKIAFLGAGSSVINAIWVGGYDPYTITDFEIPKEFDLRQTIADTLEIFTGAEVVSE